MHLSRLVRPQFFAFFLLILFACGTPKSDFSTSINEEYIEYCTMGVIADNSPVKLKLKQAPDVTINKEEAISNDIFSIAPKVKGKAFWDGLNIIFQPTEPFESGTQYQVSLNLDKLYTNVKGNTVNTFTFSIPSQACYIQFSQLESYGIENPEQLYVSGTIETVNTAELSKLKKILKATIGREDKRINWGKKTGHSLSFTIDSLDKKDEAYKLNVSWNAKSIGVDYVGKSSFEILPKIDFSVMSLESLEQSEIVIRFTDILKANQDFRGLVSVSVESKDIPIKNYTVNNNQLIIYPQFINAGTNTATVIISEGVQNYAGKRLGERSSFDIALTEEAPAIELLGKGNITVSSQEIYVPFKAVNLRAVDVQVVEVKPDNVAQFMQSNNYGGNNYLAHVGTVVLTKRILLNEENFIALKKWNTYNLNLGKYIVLKPGAVYHLAFSFSKDYSIYKKTSFSELDQMEELRNKTYLFTTSVNSNGSYRNYHYPSNYSWDERNNPLHESYYSYRRFKSTNIMCTDIGVVAKEGDNFNYKFATTSLKTAAPLANVKLRIYSFQHELLGTTQSNNDGFASIKLESKPYLLIAQNNSDVSYLRLDDGTSLSISNFDVKGQYVQGGIKGFIYGERGVWRPGDMIYVNFILEDEDKKLPDNHPVVFELTNPRGQQVHREVKTEGVNGFYLFKYQTNEEDLTGNWNANIKVGNSKFNKRIKVETIKPNRLKIDLDFGKKTLIAGNSYDAKLYSEWLHGGKVRNLDAKISVAYSNAETTFEGYSQYSFTDITKLNQAQYEDELVFEGKLNSEGSAKLSFFASHKEEAPGMLNAYYTTRVFEESGDFSINVQSLPYSPYECFVGAKLPKTESNWYKTNVEYPLDIVSLDAAGKPKKAKVKVEVYKVNWSWWWDSGSDNLAQYVNSSNYTPVYSKELYTENGKASVPLKINYTSWEDNGRYLIYVSHLSNSARHATAITAYFSKWGYWVSEGQEGATMLSFKADKEEYKVGEDITIDIPTSKVGKTLVSLENGSKVIDMFWVDAKQNNTRFSFKATREMAPNAYVHLSLIQPHAQTENDAPMRLYGVMPIKVIDPNTKVAPVIKAPKSIEAEQSYKVEVSEENGKAISYTLAVVDEGLLDITNFKTPNPWSTFYAREALGVKTWDYYDYIIGAYGARLESAFAIGGDQNLAASKEKDIRRFKPVVDVLGPFELKAGAKNKHELKMPNYAGAVRIMVVAGQDGAYGNAEESMKVVKPVMVMGTLPRVIGPDEEFELPVNVFVMDENINNVNVSVETNQMFNIVSSRSQQVSFNGSGDKIISFRLKSAPKTGQGKVIIHAKAGKHSASYEVDLKVRTSNPSITKTTLKLLPGNENWECKIQPIGMEGTNSATLMLSKLPPLNLTKRLDYLISYPHGCIEQTTSAVFPQLFLSELMEVSDIQSSRIRTNIQAALDKYIKFHTSSGGFSYWQAGTINHDWGTIYAGHFMVKARQKGYSCNSELYSKWLAYMKNSARSGWSNDLVQAYRLYVLALANEPEIGAMNLLREHRDLSERAKWRLAAAYALIGQNKVANELIENVSTSIDGTYNDLSGTFASDVRDQAMILETLTLLGKQNESFRLVERLAKVLSSERWLSTQSTAYALIAIADFAKEDLGKDEALNVKVTINGNANNYAIAKVFKEINIPISFAKGAEIKIENKSTTRIVTSITQKGIPQHGKEEDSSNHLNMKVNYFNMKGQPIDVDKLEQGTDFKMQVQVTNPASLRINYKNLALNTMFASGWEILGTKFSMSSSAEDVEMSSPAEDVDYQDIRDDRVISFFPLRQNETAAFTFTLNASYAGKFYLPATECSAMYDNEISAVKSGKWVEVVR